MVKSSEYLRSNFVLHLVRVEDRKTTAVAMDETRDPYWVGIDGTAKLLGLAPRTIRNWPHLGRMSIESIKLGGKHPSRLADIQSLAGAKVPASARAGGTDADAELPARRRGRPRKIGILGLGVVQ